MAADDSAAVARAQTDDGRPITELIAAYREGPARVRAAVADMSGEQLLARPVAGKFSTAEVVCHIADCDQFLADRMKRTIATDRPLLVGVDGIRYLDALRYQDRDLELQLRLLEVTREQMAADLDGLPDDAWERTAVHTETGLVTLRRQLFHAVNHLDVHLAAIGEKRRALGLE